MNNFKYVTKEKVLERAREIIGKPLKEIDQTNKLNIGKGAIEYDGNVTRNNLPKQTENRVAHVRPKARDSKDTYPLPDGREMTKQCFWFNNSYVQGIIND